MLVIDPYAKRMKRARNAGKPVIYDELPPEFRVQLVYILRGLIDQVGGVDWNQIHRAFVWEMGVPILGDGSYRDKCGDFITHNPDIEQILSFVEIALNLIDASIRSDFYLLKQRAFPILNSAISVLNQHFQEHTLGYRYQYPPGEIVRMDSEYLHAEAIEPAVSLLYDEGFSGASDEFIQAHKHHREGNNKAAIVSASNAFESAMKTICDIRGWEYDAQKATASALIRTLLDNNLIPSEMQSHFTGLRTTLESGVPVIRNRFAGHGQGSEPVEVPDYLTSYALHLTASNIVFLVEAHKASN